MCWLFHCHTQMQVFLNLETLNTQNKKICSATLCIVIQCVTSVAANDCQILLLRKDIVKKTSNSNYVKYCSRVKRLLREPSPECNSIVCGQVLSSFDRYFTHSSNPESMIHFAELLCSNSRKSVAKQAKNFLKKHSIIT